MNLGTKSGVVKPVVPGLAPKGAWDPTMPYVTNDVVTYLGSTYRATTNITPPGILNGANSAVTGVMNSPMRQQFTVNATVRVTKISVYCDPATWAGGYAAGEKIGLATDWSGSATIPWLGYATVTATGTGWVELTLPTPISLVPSTTYCVVIDQATGTSYTSSPVASGFVATLGDLKTGSLFNNDGATWRMPFRLVAEPAFVQGTDWETLAAKGDTGATGSTGAAGQGFTNQGAWSAATTYAPYDVVTYLGSSYLALIASTNSNPAGGTPTLIGTAGNVSTTASGSALNAQQFTVSATTTMTGIRVWASGGSVTAAAVGVGLSTNIVANGAPTYTATGTTGTITTGNSGDVTWSAPVTLSPGVTYAVTCDSDKAAFTIISGGGAVATGNIATYTNAYQGANHGVLQAAYRMRFGLLGYSTSWSVMAAAGTAGATGATGATGSASALYRGTWSSVGVYAVGDLATYADELYVATSATTTFSDAATRADEAPVTNGWTATLGTWSIVSNEFKNLTVAGAWSKGLLFRTLTADGTVETTIRTGDVGLAFRGEATGTTFIAIRSSDGFVYEFPAANSLGSMGGAFAAGSVMKVSMIGSAFIVYKNGVQVGTFNSSQGLTNTRAGLYASTAVGTLDDFVHVPYTATFPTGSWTRMAGAHTRTTVVKTTASLADLAREAGTVTVPDAAGFRCLKLSADRACRVRMYTTTAKRDADATRAIGATPTGDHGLLLDVVLTALVLSVDLSPTVDIYLPGTAGTAPITIDNLSGSTSTVAATLTYVRTE